MIDRISTTLLKAHAGFEFIRAVSAPLQPLPANDYGCGMVNYAYPACESISDDGSKVIITEVCQAGTDGVRRRKIRYIPYDGSGWPYTIENECGVPEGRPSFAE